MSITVRDGVRLNWRMEGPSDAPALVLLNSIGTDLSLWDAVVPLLGNRLRVLRLDARGHGGSDVPDGDYALDVLADDVAAVMDDAGITRAAIAGVSLGGMVAMTLALAHSKRVAALMLICTSAAMDRESWAARVATVRQQGTAAIAEMAVGRFLSPAFRVARPDVAEAMRAAIVHQPDAGYAGCAAAIRDMDLAGRIADIAVPSWVVSGREDISTPFAGHGDRIARTIAGARHVELPGAHLPPIEAPGMLAALLMDAVCEAIPA